MRRLQEFCEGALVSIELQNSDSRKLVITHDVPLRRVFLDEKTDPCNTCLVFEAGLPNERAVRHAMLEPLHIRLVQTGSRCNRLQVLAENGTTLVTLDPGMKEEAFQGSAEQLRHQH